uniref:Wall-associated receptor kinase 1 n=1 Tax=Aegilops tauschii TaxID=37682 RepID=M8BBS8_AEGTA
MECMELNPEKRPDARRIIDMLDKTESTDKIDTSSSLVGLQISSFSEQSKLQEDVNEHPETDDVAECLGNEGEENADHWSLREEQVDRKGTSISSSNSSLLDKLNILNIFRSDAQRNFVINGGQILKNVTGLKIFTKKEIKKITRNYAEFLGRGGYSRVYRGTLPDNITVAVKILLMGVDEDQMEEFVKGVEVRTQLFHNNIVKLIGYCLEADVPISVNEYAANGSLMGILHGNKNRTLPLDLRLDIAIGSAEGLRHMYSVDIQHDPVFMKTGMLTPKSDVYSFGVVLLELITRKTAYKCSLIVEYRKCYETEKSGRAMFDKKIAAEEDIYILEEIGKLTIECLNVDIEERPDMTEVTERLVMPRRDRRPVKARKS